MTIELPETVREWLETRANFAGTSVDEYVFQIVQQAQARQGDGLAIIREALANQIGYDGADEMMDKARQHLEAKLIEGLDSGPATEVNEAFWQERQRILEERIAATPKRPEEG